MYGPKSYWWEVLLALDRLLAALCNAWSDETFSAYVWRLECEGSRVGHWLRVGIDLMASRWEGHHCLSSYLMERLRDEVPPGARE